MGRSTEKGSGKGGSKGKSKGDSDQAVKGRRKDTSGFGKGNGKAALNGSAQGGDSTTVKKTKNRRKFKKKRKAGADADSTPKEQVPLCRNKHKMEKRETNPRGYKNKACCDACGKENLPMKLPFSGIAASADGMSVRS